MKFINTLDNSRYSKTLLTDKQLVINRFSILLILLISIGCQSNSNRISQDKDVAPSANQSKVDKVAILGAFHFGGSTGDLASMKMANPFGERRQNDIRELVAKLTSYRPTKILVEYPRAKNEQLKKRFLSYSSGKDTLGVNEVYQIGFRLAKQLKHSQLYAIDYKLDLPADGMVEYCQRNNKMEDFQNFIKDIQNYVQEENKKLERMSISQYLANMNSDPTDRITNELYIKQSLVFGDSIEEAGAHFAASWWERNFVILKNIAETIDHKEDRILVIIGGAHRAVLKDLVIDRGDMKYVEIGEYLN
jgi:Family of unknown function (DUF5694)